jgi:uncharacterized lipoprotein YmbA
MRQTVICFALILSGCISIPATKNSPTPRFYTLPAQTSASFNEAGAKEIKMPSDTIIGVGPIKIPQNQDRPQIVTIGKDKTLKFSEFERWGEPLDLGFTRLITENLTASAPQVKFAAYPWNSALSVKYEIGIEIVQLDSELGGQMHLVAQWSIIDVQNAKTVVMKKSEFCQPITPQDYFGLAKTLSTACASLSSDIAGALATLEVKEDVLVPKK